MKSDIIPAQRRKLIQDLIRQKGMFSVHELAEAIGVSLPTIRRDLDWLAKIGVVERSHGGATLKASSPGTTFEPDLHTSAYMAASEKARIGDFAAEQIKDKQSIIFDSSSTVFEAARRVAEKNLQLTVVTNDIRISEIFTTSAAVRLIVCGGTLRPNSYTLVGEPGVSFLRKLHVDIAVMGIHGVNTTSCSDTSLEVSYTKKHMVAAAQKILVLVDSTKFGQIAFCDAFELDDRFEIITDIPPPRAMQKRIEAKGAKVSIVKENPS